MLPVGVSPGDGPENSEPEASGGLGGGLMSEAPGSEGGNQDDNRDTGQPAAETAGSDVGNMGIGPSDFEESLPPGRQSLRGWEEESGDRYNWLHNNPGPLLEHLPETSYLHDVPNLFPPARELLAAPPPRNPWVSSVDVLPPVHEGWFTDPVLLNGDVPDVPLVSGSQPATPPLLMMDN